jgi:hypothetical protein
MKVRVCAIFLDSHVLHAIQGAYRPLGGLADARTAAYVS